VLYCKLFLGLLSCEPTIITTTITPRKYSRSGEDDEVGCPLGSPKSRSFNSKTALP
jgi:hypothetical protein